MLISEIKLEYSDL